MDMRTLGESSSWDDQMNPGLHPSWNSVVIEFYSCFSHLSPTWMAWHCMDNKLCVSWSWGCKRLWQSKKFQINMYTNVCFNETTRWGVQRQHLFWQLFWQASHSATISVDFKFLIYSVFVFSLLSDAPIDPARHTRPLPQGYIYTMYALTVPWTVDNKLMG